MNALAADLTPTVCSCEICGQHTDTPPECCTCAIAEEAQVKRRSDV